MNELLSSFLIALSAVFFVVDPIGIVPIFLAMTAGDSAKKVHSMSLRACLVGGGLLIFFALFGGVVFKVFGVSLGAFRVAGGLLLLMTSVDMLRAKTSETKTSREETAEGKAKDDVAIVPLAIPLLSGPGSIATVMVLMAKGKSWVWGIPVILAIVLTFVASYFVLRGASLVQKFLKQTGVAILQRVMGLILAAIAVQFMAEGARDLLRA
jgi:MarC family membrane protein